ncbi:hypothetical protein TR2A62_3224 [Thalassobium sp. R2A62]|nr:hypothetical protein TR2A62_3224 [Thalassobium sp. R2A62]
MDEAPLLPFATHRFTFDSEAVVRAIRSEGQEQAQTVNSIF